MLEERGAEFRYRDYAKEPLSEIELRVVLERLGAEPRDVLRVRDPAYRKLDLSGDEPADDLIRHLVANFGLLERPIAVRGGRAVVARPPEIVLSLVD